AIQSDLGLEHDWKIFLSNMRIPHSTNKNSNYAMMVQKDIKNWKHFNLQEVYINGAKVRKMNIIIENKCCSIYLNNIDVCGPRIWIYLLNETQNEVQNLLYGPGNILDCLSLRYRVKHLKMKYKMLVHHANDRLVAKQAFPREIFYGITVAITHRAGILVIITILQF
ncbi:hypothetical protein ACJX0J_009970, partial [Zea mays]